MQEEEPNFGEAGLQIPTTPTLPSASAEDATIEDDTEAKEPKQKAARTSPSSSPTAQMYPPHFAGSINRVVNDYQWEQDLYDDLDGEEMALEDFENEECEDMEEPMDKGQPPDLSAEELEKVETEAGITEITRLLAMGVMENPTPEEEEHGKLLSTRSVFDWRFCDGQWRRRCRYVAREFKAGDKGNYGTFAPTSHNAATRLMVSLHCVRRWFLCFLDVKDAFVLVPQQEMNWSLRRCLPGQRNAAARWFDFLTSHLLQLGFESLACLPAMFRHKTKNVVVLAHVDDMVLAGTEEALKWANEELKKIFTMSGGEFLPQEQSPKDPVRFLKKRYYFCEQGVIVKPHERYIPALVQLYGLGERKERATPDIAIDRLEGEVADQAKKKRFRSALGTLLYLSQDRPDVQNSVRNLAQFMSNPTKEAVKGIQHLILYLKGTESHGILLPYVRKDFSKLDELYDKHNEVENGHVLECFTDSDWAGDRSSQEALNVFSDDLCGQGLAQSWSRTQKSICLSSCEAELTACVGGVAEALHLAEVWRFLCRETCKVVAVTDSSSCRQFVQCLGVGRMKHIETKLLWIQEEVKQETLSITGVGTLLNVADLNTKKLTRNRRNFLMYLLGFVEEDENNGGYATVGEEEFNEFLRKKATAQRMKQVRRTLLQNFSDGVSPTPVPRQMVKVTLLSMCVETLGTSEMTNTVENEIQQEAMTWFGWWEVDYKFTLYTWFHVLELHFSLGRSTCWSTFERAHDYMVEQVERTSR